MFRTSSTNQEDSAFSPVVLYISVLLPSRRATHHVPFGSSLSIALACSSLTTFNSGSLTLILWFSLAPQPGRDSQYHTGPLTGLVYPVRWLHCQYAQHGIVANPAPYLDYRRLNAGSCQILRSARQLLARLTPRVATPSSPFPVRRTLSRFRRLCTIDFPGWGYHPVKDRLYGLASAPSFTC